ncbi:hypothetical protein Q5P01_007121 [Channa striata]|uniref:Immunoglobulin domain-containing protein n=1 Tax=Channa striata TaxID=64152 RepID=A0AA88N2Y7_CHASR|nr:hypothetical protein Q5P01_007121 [Channa striata]
MNFHHVLLFCFFSALCGGHTRRARAASFETGTEGQSLTVVCRFSLHGSRKSFCRGECEGTNVLIETSEDKAHSGKYSIEYHGAVLSHGTFFVTIRRLTKSDSGRYKCHLKGTLYDLYDDIELVVKDAAPTSTTHPKPTTVPGTGKQVAAVDSGFVLPLVICLPLVVLLLVLVLLLLHKLRSKRNFDGLNTGGNSDISPYEVYIPPPTCHESTYQSLDLASRDRNQIYCTIIHAAPT